MVMQSMVTAMLLATPAAGNAAPAPAPPAASASPSLQQQFDQASDAAATGRCPEALEQFSALEQRPAVQKNAVVSAAIAVRKGRCLITLRRQSEGEAAIRQGLPTLEAGDESFNREVIGARQALADIYMVRLDYDAAQRELEALLRQAKGQSRAAPLVDLARVRAFDGGPEPLAIAQEAIDLLAARDDANSKAGKEQRAIAQSIHARILLNQGRAKEGYDELQRAVSLLGGLTLSVNLADVVTRSDLAIAASLSGQPDKAREYLAYTGAGRMKDTPFASAISIAPPDCGSTEGLTREDMAIVEFSLGDDGAVLAATPIYTTRGRDVALAFARAVQDWSWSAASAKAIPPFFRYATRVEMRCSIGTERTDITNTLEQGFWQWAGMPAELRSASSVEALAAPVARKLAAAADPRSRLAGLFWLGTHRIVPSDESAASLRKASDVAQSLGAPVGTRSLLTIKAILLDVTRREIKPSEGASRLTTLLAEPAVAADAPTAATIRLTLADMVTRRRSTEALAVTQIDAVIGDSRLPTNDPLRVNALLRKAAIAARQGDLATAQASFAQTGLTEQQCALMGTAPVMRKSGASSDDFPAEARRWGFDGWVKTEYDILADGRTANQRVTVAYPPFIFNAAATGIARDSRFETSYRPETGTGCTGYQAGIKFLHR